MKFVTGRVIEGKIVIEGEALSEGSLVTVIAGEDEEFHATPEEEEELLAAIAEAERGETTSWRELRERLRRAP